MIKDYGSYLSWKAIYISNDLIDLYIPTATLLLVGLAYVGLRIWRKSHS